MAGGIAGAMDGPLLCANETEGGGVAIDDAGASDSPVLQVTPPDDEEDDEGEGVGDGERLCWSL